MIYGDFELAIEHLQRVLDDCHRLPAVLFLEGGTRLNLARAYQQLRRYPDAEETLRRAAALLERAGTPTMHTEVLLLQADLLCETGRLADAQRICEQAFDAARSLAIGNSRVGRTASSAALLRPRAGGSTPRSCCARASPKQSESRLPTSAA